MNAQIGPIPSKETVEAETAAIAKDEADFKASHDATERVIADVNMQIATNKLKWDALQTRKANLEALRAELDKKQYLGDFRQWAVNYLKSNSPEDPLLGIHYKTVTQVAIDAGVAFPTKKDGGENYFENCSKHINTFLNNSSYAIPPLFKKTKGGHYRSLQIDFVPYPQQSVSQPLAPPAQVLPIGPPTVIVQNGPVYGTNDQYAAVVHNMVPFLTTLSLQKGALKENDVLFYFREACKNHVPSLWFKNKERRFWNLFFKYCVVGGPLECWEIVHGASGDTHTEMKFQKSGLFPLEAPWRLITPVAPEPPPKTKRPTKSKMP